jgi:hypothetical protein
MIRNEGFIYHFRECKSASPESPIISFFFFFFFFFLYVFVFVSELMELIAALFLLFWALGMLPIGSCLPCTFVIFN